MTQYYEFDCGCKVEIVDDKVKDYDGLPSLNIDFDNLNLNCPIVWEVFASGRTRGVFQLETPLGAHWSKKLQPVCIDEVAALLSLLRPGTLKAFLGDKNMTQHYVDRKHGIDDYEEMHESVADIMKNTYGIMVYQEQSMKIAERLAGFDLKQADGLRKAIGKKLADLMAKVKIEFIEGCEKTGIVDAEKAHEIFDIIEKSNRYSFNACLSLDTVVQKENEFVTIDTLKVGDKILDHNNQYVEVLNIFNNGEKELFEVILVSGKSVTCTLDHEFLCSDNIKHPLSEILALNLEIMCQDE